MREHTLSQRRPTSLVQDGFIDGVDFDNNDKFCLDGQRLIVTSGGYGAPGFEYRLENETLRLYRLDKVPVARVTSLFRRRAE